MLLIHIVLIHDIQQIIHGQNIFTKFLDLVCPITPIGKELFFLWPMKKTLFLLYTCNSKKFVGTWHAYVFMRFFFQLLEIELQMERRSRRPHFWCAVLEVSFNNLLTQMLFLHINLVNIFAKFVFSVHFTTSFV